MDATHGATATSVGSADQDLVITRVFDAPRALVFMFADLEGRATVTLQHAVGMAPAAEREMCRQGWAESLDRLATCLETA